jgi:hypothetical protein
LVPFVEVVDPGSSVAEAIAAVDTVGVLELLASVIFGL